MGEKERKTVYPLLSREILTLFSCLCSLTSLSGSFGSRFDGRVKGGSCSSKGRVKHVNEGRNGNGGEGRDEGIGWRGRRKVNEYQTACFFCVHSRFGQSSETVLSQWHTFQEPVCGEDHPSVNRLSLASVMDCFAAKSCFCLSMWLSHSMDVISVKGVKKSSLLLSELLPFCWITSSRALT